MAHHDYSDSSGYKQNDSPSYLLTAYPSILVTGYESDMVITSYKTNMDAPWQFHPQKMSPVSNLNNLQLMVPASPLAQQQMPNHLRNIEAVWPLDSFPSVGFYP